MDMFINNSFNFTFKNIDIRINIILFNIETSRFLKSSANSQLSNFLKFLNEPFFVTILSFWYIENNFHYTIVWFKRSSCTVYNYYYLESDQITTIVVIFDWLFTECLCVVTMSCWIYFYIKLNSFSLYKYIYHC